MKYCMFYINRSGKKPLRCSHIARFKDSVGKCVCYQHKKLIDKASHSHKWTRMVSADHVVPG